jgi:hypothetical protein
MKARAAGPGRVGGLARLAPTATRNSGVSTVRVAEGRPLGRQGSGGIPTGEIAAEIDLQAVAPADRSQEAVERWRRLGDAYALRRASAGNRVAAIEPGGAVLFSLARVASAGLGCVDVRVHDPHIRILLRGVPGGCIARFVRPIGGDGHVRRCVYDVCFARGVGPQALRSSATTDCSEQQQRWVHAKPPRKGHRTSFAERPTTRKSPDRAT